MWKLIAFGILALSGHNAAYVAADEARAPEIVALPWSRFCLSSLEPGRQVCFTGQETVPQCAEPPGHITLYEGPNAARKRLDISLRRRVKVQRGVRIIIDRGQSTFTASISNCREDRCKAVYEAGPELVLQLKNGHTLVVEATDSADRPIRIAFSLAGFAKAFELPPLDREAAQRRARAQWQELMQRAEQRRAKGAAKVPGCSSQP